MDILVRDLTKQRAIVVRFVSQDQFDLILKLQKQVNGINTLEIEWTLLFRDAENVAPSKGNASLLIDYLLDREAIGRQYGSRWEELESEGICDFERLDLEHPPITGSPFRVKDWYMNKIQLTEVLQSYREPYVAEAMALAAIASRRQMARRFGEMLKTICLALPEVNELDEYRFAAGRKLFASVGEYGDMSVIVLRATAETVDSIPDSRRIFSISDRDGKGWVYLNVEFPIERAEVERLALDGYRIVALKRMLKALESSRPELQTD